MNIFIYWNYKDNDSKKMYQFLNESFFADNIGCNKIIKFKKAYEDFEIDDSLCADMVNSDIILFFTHGDDDAILKFRYYNELVKERFIFLDKKNANLLKEKKVIAICCRSANLLGKYCIGENVQCKFFVGFQGDLIYNEGFSDELKSLIYKAYSNAFKSAFIDAYNNKLTAERFVLILKKYISDMLTSEILSSPDRKLGSYAGVSFHRETAESLVALGQSQLLIFE